ncbi:hypothetical protein [Sphaerisporangium dianthi]|uniref:Ribosomal protein L7/L12 C-terminal domain-containing protein n=1 Tax=Sphaerisporangium dianthi TaxID=1436120 RepID=A0ABV9CLN7_9ACTN
MSNLGLPELLILIVVVAVIVAVVLVAIRIGRAGNRSSSVPQMRPMTPEELHQVVTRLTLQGRQIQAIKELRDFTRLDLPTSKAVVDGVAMGRDMWSHPAMTRFRPADHDALPRTAGPDLATRVRELKAAGREEQAVHLVRGETGMGEHEARTFVDSL